MNNSVQLFHAPREQAGAVPLRDLIHKAIFGVESETDPDKFYPVPNRAEKRRRLRMFRRGDGWKSSRRLRKKGKR